ncbi:sulfatase-like hydrolase/transferase [Microvirga pudoricolor]|uniref:sulfatase-like hydrolase/transferase n=1 Tax=Microvirga pudoricolor TaxID=2778729 RepID=UPI00194E5A3E|nr:sulfatase-like hydrolase/transferase [Microvirga pudoricolor]MBM6593721.1 sulfatase-like hydrolase/transferase [Microvirga pudoricolor]
MISRSSAVLLAAAAGILACAVFFVSIPAEIHSGNAGEFAWPVNSLVWLYRYGMAALIALTLLPALVLPVRAAGLWACLMGALAAYAWAYGNFVVYDFGLLDGQNFSLQVAPWKKALEGAFILLFLAGAFAFARARPRILAGGLLVLTLGSLATAWPALTAQAPRFPKQEDFSAFYEFSPEKNTLVILMDAMQSDLFEESLKTAPEVEAALDGFTYYPDTAGVAPTTFLSIPAIHSGIEYDKTISMPEYYRVAVQEGSVFNRLAERGYRSTVLNPIRRICPAKARCVTDSNLLLGERSSYVESGAQLLDLGLLRLAPLAVKEAVYNKGQWRIAPAVSDVNLSQHAARSNALLADLSRKAKPTSPAPTAKFLHLFNTHGPIVIDERCAYVGETIAYSRASYRTQIVCGLKALSGFLAALKREGVYDATTIVLIADHGINRIRNSRAEGPFDVATPILMGKANPTFAFKPAGAKGPMQRSGEHNSIANVAGFICAATGDCAIPASRNRASRIFHDYRWKAEYWYLDKVPGITTYDIGGTLWQGASWHVLDGSKTVN